MRNYKSYDIWIDGLALVKMVYELSKQLPTDELYGLTSQLKRASISVISNIAEGSSRTSSKDFKRFLEMSLGSLYEVESLIITAIEIEMLSINEKDKLFNSIESLQKRIAGLINTLSN